MEREPAVPALRGPTQTQGEQHGPVPVASAAFSKVKTSGCSQELQVESGFHEYLV